MTEDDGSKVRVTVDAKDPRVSFERFVRVLNTIGAGNPPPPGEAKPSEAASPQLIYEGIKGDPGAVANGSGTQETPPGWYQDEALAGGDERSKMHNVLVLMRSLPRSWFTSKDVKRFYEERFGVSAELTTISMYLGRLATRGRLSRTKSGRSFKYKLAET